jgi:hypothetical protein
MNTRATIHSRVRDHKNTNRPRRLPETITLSPSALDSFVPRATIADIITHSIPLESFCAIDKTLDRERQRLIAENHRHEIFTAVQRQNKRR